ncbi:MAG TPA: hypothetical protein VM941_13580 [Pyrinomonadaceae bacterium]|jgi:hypothetical protein|nr:hypothetical protein [Pyrinomonadaceae bacterium]
MEIFAELLLAILGGFLEFLLELAGSLLLELGLRSVKEPTVPREKRNPIFAGIGYALFGLVAGGLSLLIFPDSLARSERFHGISIMISPVLAGLAMAGFGWLLERSGKRRLRLDSFVYGFIFAMPMALVRFYFTD